MTDAPAPRRLAELFRAANAQAPAVDRDALLAALEGHGEREQRFELLSQAADHPAQAALMRTLSALKGDSLELARELRAAQAPRVSRQRPVWAALAASVALAAVVGFGLRGEQQPMALDQAVVADAMAESDRISAVSFEAAEVAENATLFGGGFDS